MGLVYQTFSVWQPRVIVCKNPTDEIKERFVKWEKSVTRLPLKMPRHG